MGTIIFSSSNHGFTLIEMIVVVALYAMLLTTVTEIFVSTHYAYRNALAIKKISQELRLVLESISRESRIAATLTANKDTDVINLKTKGGVDITFQRKTNGSISSVEMLDSSSRFITSNDINITLFDVEEVNDPAYPDIQPFFRLRIIGESIQGDRLGTKTRSEILTTVSKRNY
ncbi:hypothetical protein AUK11_04270 [bacterium CG2_30_37_16]|nr:MAG: hypothetical protein AUK11_04270 [bacterium CG2_30_37_16]